MTIFKIKQFMKRTKTRLYQLTASRYLRYYDELVGFSEYEPTEL